MASTSSSTEASAPIPSPAIQNVLVTLDTKGRVRVSKEQRRLILAEFDRSGVSAARFAKLTGLKYSTFAGWVQRYRRAKPKRQAKPLRLLEAVIDTGEVPGPAVVVQGPGQVRVELSTLAQVPLVAALVRALEKPC